MTSTRSGRGRRRTFVPLTGGRPPSPARARDTARPVPEMETFAGMDAMSQQATAGIDRMRRVFGTLQAQIGQTFDAWEQVLDEKAKAKRGKESEELGREATRIAFTDPDSIDNLIRTGSPAEIARLSRLQGIDANRPEFIEVLKATHARNMAIRDYQEKFIPALQSQDFLTGNPRALLTEFLDGQLQGANSFFDVAYRQTFSEMANAPIGQWLEHQREFIRNRQTEAMIGSTVSAVHSGGEINPQQLIGEAMAVGLTPSEKLQIRDRVIFELFRVAQETGHPALMKALAEPDPDNHGLSLADIHRDMWDSAKDNAISTWRAVNSLEAEQDLGRLNLLATAITTGMAQPIHSAEGTTMPDANYLMTEVLGHLHRYGSSSQAQKMLTKVMDMVGRELRQEAVYAQFSHAILQSMSTPDASAAYISSKDMNEMGGDFVATFLAERAATGENEAETMGKLAKAAASYGGFGSEWNADLQHKFTAGSPEEVMQAFNFYLAVERSQTFPGASAAMLSDEQAKARFDFMYTHVERFGGAPEQALAAFDEAARLRGDTNWRGFANKVLAPKDLDNWIGGIESAVRKQLGAEIPWGVRQLMEEELSRQMWMSSGVSGEHATGIRLFSQSTREMYVASVAKGMADRLEVGYDPVHKQPTVQLRSTPRVVMLPDETLRQMPGLTLDDHKRAMASFDEDITPVFGNLFGDRVVGLQSNAEARKGRGAVVLVENNVGDVGELMFPYGRIDPAETIDGGVSVPIQGELPDGMSWNKDGSLTIEEDREIRLGNFMIAPHPTIDRAASVYYVGPVPATQAELLQQRREELERRAVELETERATEEQRLETRRELGWPYTPKEPKDAETRTPETPEEKAIAELAWPTRALPPEGRAPRGGTAPTSGVPEVVIDLQDTGTGHGSVGDVVVADEPPGPEAIEPEITRTRGYEPESVFIAAPSQEHAEDMGRGEEPSLAARWADRFKGWLSDFTSRGAIGGDTAVLASRLAPEDAASFLGSVEATQQLAQIRDAPLTPHGKPKFVERVAEHIFKEEGYKSRSYQDGRTRSIGYGFNLKRDDFNKIFRDLGYDPKKLWDGTQSITREHANAVRDYEIGRLTGVIKTDLRGTGVPEHVMMALIDAAYNLGEGRVRPITRLVREGKLEEAAKAIMAIKPPSWLSARVQEVVRQRRIRNAYMLLGYDVINPR